MIGRRVITLGVLLPLSLAACGDNGAPGEAPEGDQAQPAASEPTGQSTAEPAPAPDGETYPAGTFVHAPDCSQLPAPAAAICRRPVLTAGDVEPDLSVETTQIDVDGDGRRDMLLRRRSVVDCGANGCATFVLFARGDDFVPADPPINADGPVEACRNDDAPGVRFPQAGADAACIAVTPAA